MTTAQKLEIRRSEIRQRLNEIAGLEGDAFTDEVRTEADTLTKEFRDVETKWRAATVAEAEDLEKRGKGLEGTGEGAEIRQLREKVSVFDYLQPASAGVGITGAALELNAALEVRATGRSGGVAMPLGLLETRAATTTAALDGGTDQRPILQRLFGSKNVLEALGVRLDTVPVGKSEWPLLSGGAAPAQTEEGSAAPAAAVASFDTAVLKPKRLTGRYEISAEMQAEVTDVEERLRQDLGMAVEANMCQQILTGAAPDTSNPHRVEGFLTKLTAPTAPTAAPTYAAAAAWGARAVDGLHASMESEARIVVGPAGYRTLSGVIGSGSDQAATQALQARTGGVMASPFVPAPVSDVQAVIVHGAGPNGGGLMRGDSVAAIWPTLELVRDIYSNAAEGQVNLTWIMLWDAVVAFRAAAYTRLSIFTG